MKRALSDAFRNPLYIRARFGQTIFVALLALSVFFRLGTSLEDIRGKSGLIFFCCTNQTIMNFFGTLLSFTKEKPVLQKEYSSNTYGIVSYYCAKTVVEFPFLFMFPTIFTLIIYFGAGLEASFSNYLMFWIGIVLLVLSAASLGLAVGTIFTNTAVAVSIAPLFFTPLVMFAGFIVNLDTVYVWLRWIQYISPIRYASEILLRNEFDYNQEKYHGINPIQQFGFELGINACLIMLVSVTVILRLVSLIALKVSVSKNTID